MADNVRSEDVLGEKWDRCLADTIVKTGAGFAVGCILSLVLFKRKSWPWVLGTGVGLGMGYANCQNEFRHTDIYRKVRKAGFGSTGVTVKGDES